MLNAILCLAIFLLVYICDFAIVNTYPVKNLLSCFELNIYSRRIPDSKKLFW
jgi:hypothetical protein